jgi:hypothetical protein
VTRGEACLNNGQQKVWDEVNQAYQIIDKRGELEVSKVFIFE